MENKLESQPAVLSMTVSVIRKATGVTETYTLVSDPVPLADAIALGAKPEQPQEK